MKKKKQGIFISKKVIIISVIVLVISVLAVLFIWKADFIKIAKPTEKADIKSNAEASERLTDVAEDITGLRDELNSLTRGITGP